MPSRRQKTWTDDLVEYFRELGGEAQYADLYRQIERNPRRPLGKSWQAVVRRTIEQHSSDSTIWHKLRLPDLFRSVNGLGEGHWALREAERTRNHLLLRSNVNSQWNDSDGESYHFGRTVANWKKVRAGDEAIIERIVGGKHYLIGKATVGAVLPEIDGTLVARYAEYETFGEPIPLSRGVELTRFRGVFPPCGEGPHHGKKPSLPPGVSG